MIVIGYGDGYLCIVLNGMLVVVNGCWVLIVGCVFMDMLMVDLGLDVCDCVGDEVMLWGNELFVEEVVVYIGMIGYELVMKFIL